MHKTAKSSKLQRSNSSLQLGKKERCHVGVDVHKQTYHVAVWSEERGLVATWVQPANAALLVEKLRPYRKQINEIVYEAGPTGFSLARILREAGFSAEVIAPSKMLVQPGPEAKSDRLDCRRLAMFSAKKLLRPVRVPTKQEEADRQVIRLREQFVRKSRSVQQQIKSFLLQHGIADPVGMKTWSVAAIIALRGLDLCRELRFCLDVLLDEYKHVKAELTRINKEVKQLARSERHEASVNVLKTVPGVGLITTMTFRTELLEPERFNDSRQVARMIGLAPHVSQSGETRREGRLLKSGNARLRTVLVEAAWRWVASDLSAAKRYHRLVANTGNGKKAIVGMARRLGILLWRLSVRQEPYKEGT